MTRGITDQLVKAADKATFWANSTIGLFGAPLDNTKEKRPPCSEQKGQCLQELWRNGRYWDRTSDNLLVREVLYR